MNTQLPGGFHFPLHFTSRSFCSFSMAPAWLERWNLETSSSGAVSQLDTQLPAVDRISHTALGSVYRMNMVSVSCCLETPPFTVGATSVPLPGLLLKEGQRMERHSLDKSKVYGHQTSKYCLQDCTPKVKIRPSIQLSPKICNPCLNRQVTEACKQAKCSGGALPKRSYIVVHLGVDPV